MSKLAILTQKQDAFCQEYIVDFNAKQAAIRAGYSKKSAKEQGYENLTKPHLRARLSQLIERRAERTGITADRVLGECVRIALSDVGGAFNEDGSLKGIHDIPEDIRRAISGFEVIEQYATDPETGERTIAGYIKKIKLWSKDKNIETLFKHLGMFEADNSQKSDSDERSKYKGMSLSELLKLKKLMQK